MTEKPNKSIALVTGASRGIGATIAKQLAQSGHHVIVNYASNEAKAHEVVEAIRSSGGSAEAMGFDISKSDQVDAAFERVTKELVPTHGPLKVLVNNAGVALDGLLIRMKNEDLDSTLDINLKGAIYCTRAAAKQMMRSRSGSIIMISSVIGEMGNPGQGAYAAAKAGMIGFAKSIAKELANRQVRLNVITPGFIETEMTGALTNEQKEAILRAIPLGYYGATEDVASLAAFLASDASRYITGQVIGVNGGMYM